MQSSKNKTSYIAWTVMVFAIGILITAGISQTVSYAYNQLGAPGAQIFANIKNAKINLAFLEKDTDNGLVAQSNSSPIDENAQKEIEIVKAPPTDSAIFTIPADSETIRFAFAGDITPYNVADNPNFQPFAKVQNLLRLPDITIGNLEGVITQSSNSKCNTDSKNCFTFKGDYEFAKILRNASFDIMNLANNHSHDFGSESFIDTKNALTSAGLQSTGGLGEITIVNTAKGAVAVVGFAPNQGVNQLSDLAKMQSLIEKAKQQASIVIAIFHAGAEGINAIHTPEKAEIYAGENRGNVRESAHTAIDAGADAVVISGPHVLRGMEFYNDKLIAYSLGNFMSTKGLSTQGLLSITGLLIFDLDLDGEFKRATLVPLYIGSDGSPTLDPVNTAFALINKLSSEDFGDNAVEINSEGIITKKK